MALGGHWQRRLDGRHGQYHATRLGQIFIGGMGRVEGTNQIDIDHRAKAACRHLGSIRHEIAGRPCQHDIEPAKCRIGLVSRGGDLVVVSYVGRARHCTATLLTDVGCCPFGLGQVTPDNGHRGAGARIDLRDAQIDAAATASDQGDLPGQQIAHKNVFHIVPV